MDLFGRRAELGGNNGMINLEFLLCWKKRNEANVSALLSLLMPFRLRIAEMSDGCVEEDKVY